MRYNQFASQASLVRKMITGVIEVGMPVQWVAGDAGQLPVNLGQDGSVGGSKWSQPWGEHCPCRSS